MLAQFPRPKFWIVLILGLLENREKGEVAILTITHIVATRMPNLMGYFYRSKPRNDGKNLRSDQATTHRWYFFRRFKDYIKKVQFNDEVMTI